MKNNNGIVKINNKIIVEVEHENGNIVLKPKDIELNNIIIVNNTDIESYVDGDLLLVDIDDKLKNNCYYGEFIKYLGHVNDPNTDLQNIARNNDINIEFSEQAMKEADSLPNKVLDSEIHGRLDLTKN